MSEAEDPLVLEIDRPHFIVKLYQSLLHIELKGGVKNEIEEALENKPVLRETLGNILGIFVPLHIRLSEIDSVRTDGKGKVKLVLPLHRDVSIPLEKKDANKLVEKLNQLIPKEKEKELERFMRKQKLRKITEGEHELARERTTGMGFEYPIPEPPGVVEEEKEAEEHMEEEDEKED